MVKIDQYINIHKIYQSDKQIFQCLFENFFLASVLPSSLIMPDVVVSPSIELWRVANFMASICFCIILLSINIISITQGSSFPNVWLDIHNYNISCLFFEAFFDVSLFALTINHIK